MGNSKFVKEMEKKEKWNKDGRERKENEIGGEKRWRKWNRNEIEKMEPITEIEKGESERKINLGAENGEKEKRS